MAKPIATMLGRPIATPSWPTSCLPRPHNLLVRDSAEREPIEGGGTIGNYERMNYLAETRQF